MTTPSASTGCNSAAELIAYAARVSNPNNQNNTKTAKKLLGYLIKEGHWSPFEMVSITMEITTTRDISRQILRHRSFSFQEFSYLFSGIGAFKHFGQISSLLQKQFYFLHSLVYCLMFIFIFNLKLTLILKTSRPTQKCLTIFLQQ